MNVIKLGGSLLETGQMFDCLKHILKINENTVVVCGGGDFANQIRTAQKKWQFDDSAAHEMAILAMQQTAIMCQNLQPEFVIASSVAEIKNHRFVIWSPNIVELNAAQIPATWDITSDSLATWLAKKMDASELILVKSVKVEPSLTTAELVELKIVDDAFAQFVENATFNFNVMSARKFLNS